MSMRIFLLLSFTVAATGCTKTNPNLCCTTEAGCASIGIPVGSDCASGLVCRGNQCIAESCGTSSDCDAAAPYCKTTCVEACTEDTQCPGFGDDVANIYCVSGGCVACRQNADCPANENVCDAGSCRGCMKNSECASAVCNTISATCAAETSVMYATPDGAASGACTQTEPCTATFALASATAARAIVKLANGTYDGFIFDISDGRVVTVVGDQSTLKNSGSPAGIKSSTLRMRDVTWDQTQMHCLPTVGGMIPTVELDNVTFLSTAYLLASNCNLIIRNSHVLSENNGPIVTCNAGSTCLIDSTVFDQSPMGVFEHSTLTMTNCVFTNAGTNGALEYAGLDDNSSNSISFSTFYNSKLACVRGTNQFQLSSNIFVNALPGAPIDTVTGSGCTHAYSLVTPQTTSIGATDKLNLDPLFAAPTTADFHLQPGSLAIDAANPTSTLGTDFDGIARPQGAARDMGAFEHH